MKNSIYFIFVLSVLACASQKNSVRNCKVNAFEELDSLQASKIALKYKIKVPKLWKKSSFSRGDWYFIEGDYIDSLGYQSTNADVYISKFPIKNACDIKDYEAKDFLEFYIKYRSKWFRDLPFNYILLKSQHSLYGDIYIIKYRWKGNKEVYVASAFLFMHNNMGYLIDYRNEEDNFDRYLGDAERIVNSFRIKE
jgi:hypothetical protein